MLVQGLTSAALAFVRVHGFTFILVFFIPMEHDRVHRRG